MSADCAIIQECGQVQGKAEGLRVVDNTIRVVDLFSGAGGLSLGFEKAGFEVVAAYDGWEAAGRVYQANFSHPFVLQDLSDVSASVESIARYAPTVIVGGPPCQDFSLAGQGRGSRGERAALTEAFAEIAVRVAPEAIVMENVPNAINSQEWHTARQRFLDAGYAVFHMRLNAAYYGVPQRRKRLFLIASSGHDSARFRAAIAAAATTAPLTVAEYMGDEMDVDHYFVLPRSYQRRAVFSVNEPAPTMRGTRRPVPPSYPGHHLDSADHRTVRPVSLEERARIQTFPADWDWGNGPTRDKDLMIGNAVPPELAKHVALALKAMCRPEQAGAQAGQMLLPI